MPEISKEKYSEGRINNIYNMLSDFSERNQPKDYKIKVDDMEVVHRTNDISLFNLYENIVNEHTRRIEIFIFLGKSMHCSRYLLLMKEWEQEKGMSLEKLNETIQNALAKERQRLEQEQQKEHYAKLEKENSDLKEILGRQDSIIKHLEEEINKSGKDRSIENSFQQLINGLIPGNAPPVTGIYQPIQKDTKVTNQELNGDETSEENYRKVLDKSGYSKQESDDLIFVAHLRTAFGEHLPRILNVLDKLRLNIDKLELVENILNKEVKKEGI